MKSDFMLIVFGAAAGLVVGVAGSWAMGAGSKDPAATSLDDHIAAITRAPAATIRSNRPDPRPARSNPPDPPTCPSGENTPTPIGVIEDGLGVATYYTDAGPVPCDEACLDEVLEAYRSGDPSEAEVDRILQLSGHLARRIERDPALLREFMAALTRHRSASDVGYDGKAMLLENLAYSFSGPAMADAGEALMRSGDPRMQTTGVSLIVQGDEGGDRAARAVGEALSGPIDENSAYAAIYAYANLNGSIPPRTEAAMRDIALNSENKNLRRAALESYVQQAKDRPDTAQMVEQALGDEEPSIRLAGISAFQAANDWTIPEESRVRMTSIARDIADDTNADPETRMQALSLLAYELSEETEHAGHSRERR